MSEQQPSQKSNFILFLVCAFAVMIAYTTYFQPKQPPKDQKQVAAKENQEGKEPKGDENKENNQTEASADKENEQKNTGEEGTDKNHTGTEEKPKEGEGNTEASEETPPEEAGDEKPTKPGSDLLPTDKPPQWITLGSADPESPYAMLVTLTDRGAAVTRVELNSPRYPQLMDDKGYLADRQGYLGRIVMDEKARGKGCPVNVVGKGTPAEKAGIKPGDLILDINGRKVTGHASYLAAMDKTRPHRTIKVTVLRDGKEHELEVTLTRPPVEVIHPEGKNPQSFLMTLSQLGDDELKKGKPKTDDEKALESIPDYVTQELSGLNLRTGSWTLADHTETKAVFECELPGKNLKLVKTYRLAKSKGKTDKANAYHLMLDIQIENIGKKPIDIAYQLDGPTGLPIEGWWYANKVAYCWGAGLRDVIVYLNGTKDPEMVACKDIASGDLPPEWEDQSLNYIGVDAQYFTCVMIPQKPVEDIWLSMSYPIRVGPVENKDKIRLTDVSCRMRSITKNIEAGKSLEHTYEIFTGPKAEDVLAAYKLESLVTYGWFDFFARPMVKILHFFHAIIGNYGLAILMLTVLVRGLMYPMSRKQALGAAKMAELQPEIKKIQTKYKDLNERHRAQQELYKKHNFNPLAGCLVMFVQLPIFIGLYRGLMVDIELRGSSLLGSWVRWCSNLAAPDMLIDWSQWMPEMVTSGVGFLGLGPYFNLLPILTIILFIVQQKLIMPPAADEQQAMQQKMMKYMMLFMGLLFFKVAAGLCVYFIASALWSVAERKLLPKHPRKDNPPPAGPSSAHRRRKK